MRKILNGRYRLRKKLGSGAHGISYLAYDEQNKQDVVVKRLRQELTTDSRKMWPKESRMLQRLEHPQIPKFIDFFEAEVELELLPHLVQEYIPGKNLLEVMKQKALTPQECMRHVMSILEILVYLQSVSPPVVHRDIKPENIILHAENQKLYLIDFGISTTMQGQTFGHTMAVGTLGYQSKEQIEGYPVLSSDVYSLGVVAAQWMSGRTIEELYSGFGKITWREYLPYCPPQILDFLEKMLHSNTSRRYANAKEALTGAKGSLNPSSRSVSKNKNQKTPVKKKMPLINKGSGKKERISSEGYTFLFAILAGFAVFIKLVFFPSLVTWEDGYGYLHCTKGEHTLEEGWWKRNVGSIEQFFVKGECVLRIRNVTIRDTISVYDQAKLIVENSTVDTITTTGSAQLVLTKSTVQEVFHKAAGTLVVEDSTIGECHGFGCEHKRIDLPNLDEQDHNEEHGSH